MDNIQQIVKCNICARECGIKEGGAGFCRKYTAVDGDLHEIAPDKYLVVCCISIETMPMQHFYPGGKFLQITTTGCNFDCLGCVSTVVVKEMGIDSTALQYMTAEQIVEKAIEENCIGITFLMNDPIASFFTFLNVAKKARASNLMVGCSSNGYFTAESSQQLAPYLDFINIGIKGFSDEEYQACGAAGFKPVLESIKTFIGAGTHVEVSCTYKKYDEPGIGKFAAWLTESDYNIPLQIMRYIPLEEAAPEFEPTINEAECLCRALKQTLNHVYLFNSPGTEYLNTYCPECGNVLIARDFYGPMGAKTKKINSSSEGKCLQCNNLISIPGLQPRDGYKEKAFEGGYPFTRALEMIQAILIASGVVKLSDVVKVWEKILSEENGLDNLHLDLNSISRYISVIQKFTSYIGADEKAKKLTLYMQEKINQINEKLVNAAFRPRVYYAMGKPLFCLKGERFENQLVTAAGGVSVNKEVQGDGRPGLTISVEELNRLNPEVIFISSFISNTIEDFYRECLTKGIKVDAVRSKRIINHSYPNWDFGSPRWILGLMNIANILHPEMFSFDMLEEAKYFYSTFYNTDFDPERINLSFAKPVNNWRWK
ncbi:MAG TPA: radical SAM protein [Desulfotomaculum sp.]|nr:MAG: Radical SAM superfamily protein [Desulfotomaculum sp. 46_296]HAG12010.1 radical SAM protein [Desulfotomaculum sp.]HBY05234.1 radical SAM protein [Desulfotomaculum sp.]